MSKGQKKAIDVNAHLEKMTGAERFAYKLLRGCAWVTFGFAAALAILGLFDGFAFVVLAILPGCLGWLAMWYSKVYVKQVTSPEYREKLKQQKIMNKAAWNAVKAVTKEIVTPSEQGSDDDEDSYEEDEAEDFEGEEENEFSSAPVTYANTVQTVTSVEKKPKEGSTMIRKSVAAVKAHVGSISEAAASALPDIIESMQEDEVILHAFTSMMLERNHGRPGRDSATNIINILTNKRYYFAGTDGQSNIMFAQKKSGSVSLRDVHATNAGTITMQGAYVGFETRNDDYKIWLGAGVKGGPIKAWFDEAIRKAQDVEVRSTTIQAALSPADELKKFKELLDMGVITQEEFNAKKKQLLGL